MPLPRFMDDSGDKYDVSLCCPCGYAIVKDKKTMNWKNCPLCVKKGKTGTLKTKRHYYGTHDQGR